MGDREITLDDMIESVHAAEALIKEPDEVAESLSQTSFEVYKAAKSGKVGILTDYDADGITSAYIMEQTLKAVNPDCDVEVICNDRRGSYGLSPDVQGNPDTRYIICDMGSNQLELARERLGNDVIIIDHHLIEGEKIRQAFADNTSFSQNACLCNPHSFHIDDSKNAQYCAAGLAYRVFQETEKHCNNFRVANKQEPFHADEKATNTVAIMACIGTATDMVNVLDLNGYNRQILKDGLQRIDNADENNLNFVIGYMLAQNKINDGVTAHQLAFNVGAFLNSASRMSEIAGENGAQRMYNAITANENDSATYRELDALQEQNQDRKRLIFELTSASMYQDFIDEHRYGERANDNIGIYRLPNNVPAAFAGLIAGKLTEATDKAIICLTYSDERGCYTGSGRNADSNATSLMDFMQLVTSDIPEDYSFEIRYGGHSDAIGISYLDDIGAFKDNVERYASEMASKSQLGIKKETLKITPQELSSPETLEKMLALEPTGVGLKIPSMQISGTEQMKDKLFKAGRSSWKTVRIKDESGRKIDVADWSYSSASYPISGKNEIALVAELGINDYKGIHTELTAKFDRDFFASRQKEVEKQHSESKKNAYEYDSKAG